MTFNVEITFEEMPLVLSSLKTTARVFRDSKHPPAVAMAANMDRIRRKLEHQTGIEPDANGVPA